MKKEAMLYEKLEDKKVHCKLCSHHCEIAESKYGFCGVRKNIGGTLYSLVYGDIIAAQTDPIEKKPLYHFLPGSKAFSIATPGCNFRCSFCQNWQISQITKKDDKENVFNSYIEPKEIVENALNQGCESISFTYTEPTIFFEYAYDTAKIAKKQGLKNTFVTNGYLTGVALEKISPFLDAANVDIKSFREDFYKEICKAKLKPVLDSIKKMKKLGIWVEVTTLVVPNQNDSEEELNDIANFISSVGKEIPWHISRFHPDYKYNDSYPTPIENLHKAYNIGKKHGLKYVYLGNVLDEKDTVCNKCGEILIKRDYMGLNKIKINKNGECNKCNITVDGVWS